MNLSDNLKRIRKEHGLSQEQLAEQLGVSRQAVSKWESEQSYPEMDKVLLICKLFNYNMDELMNGNVKEVDEEKQSKINANKYIEDFFSFITKTVDMLSSMTWKQKVKCLTEQIMIGLVLASIFAIIGGVIGQIVRSAVMEVNLGITIRSIGIIVQSIYSVLALIMGTVILLYIFKIRYLGTVTLLYIFKIRYLDYYEIVKVDKEETREQAVDIQNTAKREKERERIIIRDPKDSESRFLKGILRIVLWGIKSMAIGIAFPFAITLAILICLLVISFLFVKTGLVFVGIAMTIIAGIIVNYIILQLLYYFIVSKKTKKNILAITFLVALTLAGMGSGLVCVGITDFSYSTTVPEDKKMSEVHQIKMTDGLVILDCLMHSEVNPKVKLVAVDEENINHEIFSDDLAPDEIRMVTEQSKYCHIFVEYIDEKTIAIYSRITENLVMDFIREVIHDINDRKMINNYNQVDLTIYSSRENIEKLKGNIF